jgi:hypothetical protein
MHNEKMNEQNTNKILKDFPVIYSHFHYGFDCGDGWFDIIYDLSKMINDIDKEVRIVQIKEKYGTLRFYVDWCSDEIQKLIAEAEERSCATCEECGRPGKVRMIKTWMLCRCEACFNENLKLKNE